MKKIQIITEGSMKDSDVECFTFFHETILVSNTVVINPKDSILSMVGESHQRSHVVQFHSEDFGIISHEFLYIYQLQFRIGGSNQDIGSVVSHHVGMSTSRRVHEVENGLFVP
jgi:hypothetical protein